MVNSLATQPHTLIDKLVALRAQVSDEAGEILAQYAGDSAALKNNKSARNLSHYLAMRRHDLRAIQSDLTDIGVSSLGRCEAHVLFTLNQVISTLESGYVGSLNNLQVKNNDVARREGRALLEKNTEQLFGRKEADRQTRIMVTLPSQAAWDEQLVYDLIIQGMNCGRCIGDCSLLCGTVTRPG